MNKTIEVVAAVISERVKKFITFILCLSGLLAMAQDDTWTGAAVKDEFVNGTNVRKFILPEQNHWLQFNSDTDLTQCNAIRDMLDEVLGAPQGIAPIGNQPEQNGVSTRKMLRDGQLYLNYNGHLYDVRGTRLQ